MKTMTTMTMMKRRTRRKRRRRRNAPRLPWQMPHSIVERSQSNIVVTITTTHNPQLLSKRTTIQSSKSKYAYLTCTLFQTHFYSKIHTRKRVEFPIRISQSITSSRSRRSESNAGSISGSPLPINMKLYTRRGEGYQMPLRPTLREKKKKRRLTVSV
ncbi:hypothetical protein DM02DRAFT_333880 [Periconia macrospinosa]|uniref:Uncharacterized protein n=1 Tax=Periconia macrospinosa TaxID=97972 RepID=A0A2V1DUD7_9PLEO|nr:hypothetical protein DM02DRAFT_333880 [Periconia macrospinosa]